MLPSPELLRRCLESLRLPARRDPDWLPAGIFFLAGPPHLSSPEIVAVDFWATAISGFTADTDAVTGHCIAAGKDALFAPHDAILYLNHGGPPGRQS